MAASYDKAWCLARWKSFAGRPTANDVISDTTAYQWLAEAQQELVADIAAICPSVLYGAPVQMVTADGGYTFTFGTDAYGNNLTPFGKVGIYKNLADVPDAPWQPGVAYYAQGANAIRIPNNATFGGTLYFFGITMPPDISASQNPSILPEPACELIVYKAVRNYAEQYARNLELADRMAQKVAERWPRWLLVWKTQYRGGGALGGLTPPMAFGSYGSGLGGGYAGGWS